MKPFSLFALALAISTPASAGQPTKTWTTKTTDEGRISVRYSVSEMSDERGEVLPLIEYTVTTTEKVGLQNCVDVINNVANHKELGIADRAETVNVGSDDDAIVYYYLDAPWPMQDTDIVVRVTASEDVAGKSAVYTQTAAPKAYADKGLRRFQHYDMTYRLKDIGDDRTEVTLTASMSPGVPVPLWLLEAGVPDTAAKVVRNIVRLAGRSK